MSRSDEVEEKALEALLDQQQEAISLHESLLRTMCSANSGSAGRILECLRSGAYDDVLRPEGSATLTGDANVRQYPWERELRQY